MKTYNFNMAFSPLEFQKFARDMLQKRENVFFESFAEGRDDVIDAINRARKIMQRNQDNEYILYHYKGYQYYKENPSLTAWEAIEKILEDCELA